MLDWTARAEIERLRAVLAARGYADGVERVLGEAPGASHRRGDLPLYLRRLVAPLPLHTLIKLFGLYVPVSEAEACAAFAPMTLDEVEALGLLEKRGDTVVSRVGLVAAFGLVLARDRVPEDAGGLRPEHVLGLNPPALTLASLTVRRRVRRALDLGCGGGIQALLAARHAERVVAVDVNPRALAFTRFNAALNGIANVECREGSWFEPLAGERFDLALCNPPYTISPDHRFVFRDGGRSRDALCAEIVGRLPEHLEEGGFASVLCNWALGEGEEWSAPLRRWVAGRPCDAWLLRSDVQDPLTYAAGWNRGRDEDDYASSLDRWLAYDAELGIAALGLGAVVLRRRSGGRNWVRADLLPERPSGSCSDAILRAFVAQDHLHGLENDAALLRQAYRAAEGLQVEQRLVLRGGALAPASLEIRLADGLGSRGAADIALVKLLELCDGRRPVGELLADLGLGGGAVAVATAASAAGIVRRLVAQGFLLPAKPAEGKGRTSDGESLEGASETHAVAEGLAGPGGHAGAGSDRTPAARG